MSTVAAAIIGLDTSHTIGFARAMHDTSLPAEQRIEGMRITSVHSFVTPFQDAVGIAGREKEIRDLGIPISQSIDESLRDADAIILAINDPSLHREYYEKVLHAGKPVYIDKPFANTLDNAAAIDSAARTSGVRTASFSSVRYNHAAIAARKAVPTCESASFFGLLSAPPAGSRYYFYPVHTIELMQAAMGNGATSVRAVESATGLSSVVTYRDGREASADMRKSHKWFGGTLMGGGKNASFVVDWGTFYRDGAASIRDFFTGSLDVNDTSSALEVMSILDAIDRSCRSGKDASIG